MKKDLDSLIHLVQRIRKECKSLDDNVAAAREGKLSDEYLAGHFSYVEQMFSEYSAMVRETEAEEDQLDAIKREADETYRHLCSLRAAEQPQQIAPDRPEEQSQQVRPVQEEIAEDDDNDGSSNSGRLIRKPQILTKSHEPIQQLQWEKAAALGMNLIPGQTVTELQIREFQRERDRQQEDSAVRTAENLKRSTDTLAAYREKQQSFTQQGSIGNSHIDMSRDIFNRKSTEQHTDGEVEPERSSGYTKADAAASGDARQRYTLNSIAQNCGSLSYVTFSQMVQRAAGHIDHDVIRAGMTGSYYLKTAYNAVRIPASSKPTAALQHSAQRITGKQLTANRNNLIRQHRELRSQISKLERQLQGNAGQKLPAQLRQADQLAALRSQLPGLQRELKNQEWIRNFQHHRTLDQQLVKELSVKKNHRMPSGSKELQELSRTILKKREEKILTKYGRWQDIPTENIPGRIRQLTDRGATLKKQLRILQGKGVLTAQERQLLMKYRQQLTDTGRQISDLKGLLHAREDLSYMQDKLSKVLRNAGKRRQRIMGTAFFLRNMALRPAQAGMESNTEWFSKSVSFATDPRTIRYTKKVVSGTARLSGRVLHKVAPTADNWVRYQVSQRKNAVRKTMQNVRKGVKKAVPTGVKKAAHTATAPIRGVQKIGTGIHNRVYAAKRMIANTRMGMWLQKQYHLMQSAGQLITKGALMLKSLALKALAGFLALFLVAGLIASAAGMIAGSASTTMILSPFGGASGTSDGGKIDLSIYSQIIRSEISAFNDRIDGIRSEYEGNPDYDNVDVQFSGVGNNLREILSMMAVRMEQDLDTAGNPAIEPYLRYLVDISHTYEVLEHRYSCSGCQYRDVTITTTDPETGEEIEETVQELFCPGHIDVTISVNILSFEELMAHDHFSGEDDDWPGWNDEKIAWCKAIYEMDWTELYTGFSISHNTTVGTVISPEDEAHIWNTLLSMTGNPFGTAGLMGNLYAESGLNSKNLQNSYEELLGYDDEGYTNAVDSGSYGGFTEDRAGYGLAQWTDGGRKAGLLAYARSRGVSIGNLDMQLGFLGTELTGTGTFKVLQRATSVKEASDEVLVNFERPADQSDNVKLTRASFGEYFYNKYQLGVPSEGHLTQKQIDVIKVATNSAAYGIPANKGYCQAWAALVYGAAGLRVDDSPSAYQSGVRFGVSDDWKAVPPGAAVYGYAGNQYGHVGIYVGNGLVYHNIGGVAVDTLEDWIRIYDGFVWGWQAGEDLTVP